MRTRDKGPGRNGSCERGFGSSYERLFLEEFPDGIELWSAAEAYRIEYNKVRPHEALSWNRPSPSSTPAPPARLPQASKVKNPATCSTRGICTRAVGDDVRW
ncbi:integrase core domain-containing protein [Streptomyces hirsutus]|uniref:integrase core domain-containing protein n=1 Tax=Streptomyces hirsutus TaxID=35620 RepID=UPI00342B2B5F